MSGRVPRIAFGRLRAGQQFDRECSIRREGSIVQTKVPCTLVPAVDENQRFDDEVVGVGGWIVVVPVNTNVESADRILIDAQTFMVLRVLGPGSHTATWRLLCSEA